MPNKLMVIVGARPNFMKAAPLMSQLHKHKDRFEVTFIHTGQHYDHKLSQLFFDQLGLPKPDINLGVGSGSHGQQTAKIMIELEKLMIANRPDLAIVFGDVNSTMATALVTSKLHIKLAHVESGLRSFDKRMPEEINRIVTDRLSDFLFISEKSGMDNLLNEGMDKEKLFFVGNIMIDSLIANLEAAKNSDILDKLSLQPGGYVAMTLHRPANVDNKEIFENLLKIIEEIGQKIPVVFPCHPRTTKELSHFGLIDHIDKKILRIIEPLGYLDFLKLQSECKFVLTDSGGIQEETTYLQIPCITLRDNTERPVTVDVGSNVIVGVDPDKIRTAARRVLDNKGKVGRIPDLWDGHTAERIVDILLEKL
jgi:UDP-N-acetylglucosamine 2-epimerase (non-hydrolysing)